MIENIFESHAHFDDERFDEDREQLLSSMNEKGVRFAINIGSSLESSQASVDLADKYDFIYAAVGVHPEEIADVDDAGIEKLRELAKNKKVVAIGEIGLDYHYRDDNKEEQIAAFRRQMELAKELSLPVIIHSRDACEDTLKVLREYKPRGVVHCFSGSAETAKEVVALGMYVGFTGVVTFKNARRALEAVEAVPLDRLLCETDCPYMAPEPNRGKRCDSTMLEFILAKMAEIKGVSTQELADKTCENAKKLFGVL